MQWVVVGRDGQDDGASARRMAVREQHIALTEELMPTGSMLYGVALLDVDGAMVGSMVIVDFPTREDVDAWLAREPYAVSDVWRDIQVYPARVGPSFQHLLPPRPTR